MKNNHLKVEVYIKQAITACSYHSSLEETRNYLQNALISLSKTTEKRAKNKKNENIKTQQETWWEMLKKNAANNAANNFNIDIEE
jgi:hypothetical protein